ncbi:MAG TPA: glutamate-5-semialdehyde dehydrogenase [Terriglobales bacterium]|jgi:glutamate-5-semialdehyde dehydrogenase|nr:glutamate-5-semialdehyde dehydrogenase [Terriglobales bacterium]
MAGGTAVAFSTREKLERARLASTVLAQLSTSQKNALLLKIADGLEKHSGKILRANDEDVQRSNLAGAMRDRLLLTPERIAQVAASVRDVAALPDPVNEVLEEWTRPNGLLIRKVRVPLGVVGIVYESRPNVTVDAAVLCLKTGNAVVLRGGKEASASNQVLAEIMAGVDGIPAGAIELLDSTSRDSVQELIRARGLVDVVIPRGGPGLIAHVMENALVPVIETGAGNCHIFVDESADFEMANRIILNAKTQRPSVCNAAEKLLVHVAVAAKFIPQIARKLTDAGVELRGDTETRRIAPRVLPATEQDWGEEYLRLCMAIGIVSGVDEAIEHINRYSTKHSEAIVTVSEINANKFLRKIDSAAVYWNASTRFTDGSEFGFGAEMGVSTQKLHCRGPFALKELTSTKYQIKGTGQIRE